VLEYNASFETRPHTGNCAGASDAISSQTDSPCAHIGQPLDDHRTMMTILFDICNGSKSDTPE
jgi:hypothetical protein